MGLVRGALGSVAIQQGLYPIARKLRTISDNDFRNLFEKAVHQVEKPRRPGVFTLHVIGDSRLLSEKMAFSRHKPDTVEDDASRMFATHRHVGEPGIICAGAKSARCNVG